MKTVANPSFELIEEETHHLLMCYCTFVNNVKGRKMSAQNVLVVTLEEPKLKNIIKLVIGADTDYEVVKTFLDFDPSIAKSKYVTKYVNSTAKRK